jgi:RNA polymerase sigma-70 factor (ECF subfamily)
MAGVKAGSAVWERLVMKSGEAARAARDVRYAALMAAAQAGNRIAYETLLREVTPWIHARIRNVGKAQNVLQAAPPTLHELRHAYVPDRSFGPWLTMAATRRAVGRLRRQTRIRSRKTALDEVSGLMIAVPPAADEQLDAQRVRSAVAALPKSQRVAVTLAKLQDLSVAAAASHSGLAATARKVATHRAMRNLRSRLGVESRGHADG